VKVKIVHPEHAAGFIDPQTMRSPFIDAEGKVAETADVPDNTFWVRRILAGELVRLAESAPVGNEPIAPLTTREGK
jgi:hypothetical protein